MGDEESVQNLPVGSSVAPVAAAPSVGPSSVSPPVEPSQEVVFEDEGTSGKGLWLWVGIAFVCLFLIIGVLFVLFSGNSVVEISEEEFEAGKAVSFEGNDKVVIDIGDEEHAISIESVDESSVEIVIQSDTIRSVLNVGETKSFDVDGDGIDDLIVKLEEIVDGEPVLFVKKFVEEVLDLKEALRGNDSIISTGSQNCIEDGGYVCSSEESCAGTLINTFGNLSCCNIECIVIDSYEEGAISYDDYCLEKDGYLFTSWESCTDAFDTYYSDIHNGINYIYEKDGPFNPNTAEAFRCCRSPVSASNVSVVQTCSDVGGYICSDWKECKGVLKNVVDSSYCCSEECVVEDSPEQICLDKGQYLYLEGDFCGGVLVDYHTYSVPVSCCEVPISEFLPSSLRITWDSISDSGECPLFGQADYISNLGSCSPYKCHYTHLFFDVVVTKGIVGDYDEKCHSLEELPNDGEMYCRYDDSQLADMTDYLIFYEEQCSGGTCVIVSNETGYFVNGILTENVLQDMTDSGDCVSNFA